MKTRFKFVALIVVAAVSACEPDVVDPEQNGWRLTPGQKAHYNGAINSYDSDIVLKWNEALGSAIENKMPIGAEARIYAMVTLAMHDALNNIIPKYETYALTTIAPNVTGLNRWGIAQVANAAVSQAAHGVLTTLYPPSKADADVLLSKCLAEIDDPALREKGVAVGSSAATAMLAKRQEDAPLTFTAYSNGTAPGVHQANYMPFAVANPPVWPANAVYGANLGSFAPFGLTSGHQFRPDPPHDVTSKSYTVDYNEVKKLGCVTCVERTLEQTAIGDFWKVNTSGPMNQIARTLAEKRNLNGWETARLLALTQMAQIDANIASFEAKFYYNYWLPVTAIRAGDADGNDDTQGDPGWVPVVAPPPAPDYPSTPACAGGAGAEIFRQFFWTDKMSFTITSSQTLPGIERSYTSFSQVSKENALSRVYLGSHFRNAVIEGERQGRKIGQFIFEKNLKELAFLM